MRFLFVDRILKLTSDYAQGIKHITPDDYYLCQNDDGKLSFISSLIGESLGQLAAWNIMYHNDFTRRPVAGVVGSARLLRPAYLGETLLLESFFEAADDMAVRYHSVAKVGEEVVFQVESALGPMLPMNEFIDEATVRQQFEEIYRPTTESFIPFAGEVINQTITPRIVMGFDRVISMEPGVQLSAAKFISRSAAYFPDHFPRKPVLPMTVLLECKLNLAKEFLKHSHFGNDYIVAELRRIKMNDFVRPGDIVVCHLTVKENNEQELVLSFRSEVDGKRVCVLEVEMRSK